MFTAHMDLVLAPDDRRTLEQMLRQTTLSQAIAKRVRVVLALAAGDTYHHRVEATRPQAPSPGAV